MTSAPSEPIRVVVELDPASVPIQGSIQSDAGPTPFNGWMELTAALEDARTMAAGVGDRRRPDSHLGANEDEHAECDPGAATSSESAAAA